MNMSTARVRAIARKEFRDYRRNRFIVFTMAVFPSSSSLVARQHLAHPGGQPSAALDAKVGLSMLFMLLVPAMVPATISAYSVVGEREQGTLEPVLTTPVRNEEFLLGKALAALAPTLADLVCHLRPRPGLRGALRPAGGAVGRLPGPAAARPGALHAAHRRLVHLGRHRHLGPAHATSG